MALARKKVGSFAEYIKKFLKEKMEANGWPADCVSEDQRQHFLKTALEKEGIVLYPSKIENSAANIAVVAFTTSYAQLKLLNMMGGWEDQLEVMSQILFVSRGPKVQKTSQI